MALATILALSLCYVARCAATQRQLASKLIRLHVVANSDSQEDQRVKLEIRDAVLARVEELTADCSDVQSAKACLSQNLPALEAAAEEALQRAGHGESVAVSLGRENFPTRYYDTFTLPAGPYTSLRVSIGEGSGHNWWCVVFPSLCVAATCDEWEEAAEAGAFTDAESRFIAGGEEEYELKFKTLEYLQKFWNWLT